MIDTNSINSIHTMKTAISVDDDLLEQADNTARQMGLSRSRLFSVALEEYLRRRRQEATVQQLNRAYAGQADATEQRLTARMKAKFRSTIKDRW